jgi:hypothetical protein
MVIITVFGALVVAGVVFAALKKTRNSSERRNATLHIV